MIRMQTFRQLKLATLLLLTLLSFVTMTSAADSQENDAERAIARLAYFPEMENWDLSVSGHTINLKSKFTVNVSSSQAFAMEPGADSSEVRQPNKQAFKISITFLPFERYQDLTTLVEKRRIIAADLNRDAFDLDAEPLAEREWLALNEKLAQTPLPTHVAGESLVTISSDLDNETLSIEPSDELKECVWMLYRIGFLFTEIKR